MRCSLSLVLQLAGNDSISTREVKNWFHNRGTQRSCPPPNWRPQEPARVHSDEQRQVIRAKRLSRPRAIRAPAGSLPSIGRKDILSHPLSAEVRGIASRAFLR